MTEQQSDSMEQLTAEEMAELQKFVGGVPSVGLPEEKHNVHKFLYDVSISDDTTKTGYLKDEELGIPKYPVRTYKELQLFCKAVAGMDYYADYFAKKAEIITSTSLSKNAKLLDTAVVTRRELADVSKPKEMKKNRGWFKKKGGGTQEDG